MSTEWWCLYEGVRERITAAVGSARESALEVTVPACPSWTARDLVAHLVGLDEDVVSGRVKGYASGAWTADQVARGGKRDVVSLLDAWVAASQALREAGNLGGTPIAQLAFGDAVVHEADLVGLRLDDHVVPDDDVGLAVKAGISRWRPVLAEIGAPALHVVVRGHRDWWLGDRDGREVTELEVDQYELFRALYGRRSLGQMRALTWSGPPDPFLAQLPYPFTWAEEDLES